MAKPWSSPSIQRLHVSITYFSHVCEASVMSIMQPLHNKCTCVPLLVSAGPWSTGGENRNRYGLSFPDPLSQLGSGLQRPVSAIPTSCHRLLCTNAAAFEGPHGFSGDNRAMPLPSRKRRWSGKPRGFCSVTETAGKEPGCLAPFQGSDHHSDRLSQTSQLWASHVHPLPHCTLRSLFLARQPWLTL